MTGPFLEFELDSEAQALLESEARASGRSLEQLVADVLGQHVEKLARLGQPVAKKGPNLHVVSRKEE